jgi:hypothetical protein
MNKSKNKLNEYGSKFITDKLAKLNNLKSLNINIG